MPMDNTADSVVATNPPELSLCCIEHRTWSGQCTEHKKMPHPSIIDTVEEERSQIHIDITHNREHT